MDDNVILLVEDNPDDVALTLRAFNKNNILNNVIVASDGREALDYLYGTGAYQGRDVNVQPNLILLDLKLPKIDGLTVLRQIRGDERTKRQPVVILSTSKEDKDLIASYELGVNSYIVKPVDFRQFTDVVRQLGLYWLVLNAPPPKGDSP